MPSCTKQNRIRTLRKFFANSWPFILSLAIFLSVRLSIRNPGIIEHYYSRGIYPFIARFFSFFSNLIPFSLWDIFWVIVIMLIIAGLILALFKKIRFGRYILRTLQLLAIFYSLFYVVWGYNYFRQDIEKRIGWVSPKTDEKYFWSVLDTIIQQTNSNHISISSFDYPYIDKLIEDSYRSHSKELGLDYPNGKRRPKTMIFSSFYGKLGLNGYFGPFFNEIHVNHYVLSIDYPFLLAHEKAHQFGIASESEANLVAFAICVKSGDRRLEYSGYMSLLLYFLSDAFHMKDYREHLKKIDSTVSEDLRFRRKYYQSLQSNTLSDIQTAANNSYLKANNIEKGVRNYNQVVSLVLSWYFNSNLSKSKN